MRIGIFCGIAAYCMWGVLPIYWKVLHQVPSLQVIGHRILWSFVALLIYIVTTGQWSKIRTIVFTPKLIASYLGAAVLLSVNWLIYVWGVNSGFVVETSLGYFILPLLSVFFGVAFLQERLRPTQWIPVLIAGIGVAYLAYVYGHFPWIALTLAVTFGLYGLVKKLSPLGSLLGLTLETSILFPVALLFLGAWEWQGAGAFTHSGVFVDLFLIGAGIVTTIPLLLFAAAARRIPLSTLGVLQYISPTLQFACGVFIFKESFSRSHLIGFCIVWIALVLFWAENYLTRRPTRPANTGCRGFAF